MRWKEMLPYLALQIALGDVWRYDAIGFTRELTKEQEEKIKELESDDLTVVAVIDADYQFQGCTMHFNTYLFAIEGEIPEVATYNDRNYVVFYSFVQNMGDSSSSEYGDVGVIEHSELLKRIY
jgi:hypothetical protein